MQPATTNEILQAYQALKPGQKRRLITQFLNEYKFYSIQTFYNKLNGTTKVRQAEQSFFINHLCQQTCSQ